jgi:cysteine desulfuration protein SufE
MTIDEILEDFSLLDDWEDRYRYVIELGKELEPLPESERTAQNKVRGCASQVWLSTRVDCGQLPPRLRFRGDSDAHIVRGLITIVFALFDNKTPSEILDTDAEAVFKQIGLRDHLTAQRSNGLKALVDRIKFDADALHAAAT